MLSLDGTLIWTIVNIIVLFILLRIFLFKPVTNIMEKRRLEIENSINHANEKEQSAIELHQKYEEDLKSSKSKADDLVIEAKKKAQNEYDKIVIEARTEAARVLETANKNIEMLKRREIQKVQESIVDIALAAAVKASEDSIDEQKSKKLLEELVMKAGA